MAVAVFDEEVNPVVATIEVSFKLAYGVVGQHEIVVHLLDVGKGRRSSFVGGGVGDVVDGVGRYECGHVVMLR
jgi:hypothetical protein